MKNHTRILHIHVFLFGKVHLLLCTFSWKIIYVSRIYAISDLDKWFIIMHIFVKNLISISHMCVFQFERVNLLFCTFSWKISYTYLAYVFSKLENSIYYYYYALLDENSYVNFAYACFLNKCIYYYAFIDGKSTVHFSFTRFPIWKSAFDIMQSFIKKIIYASRIYAYFN